MVCLCCERRRGRTQSGREARTVRLAPRSSAASPVTDLSICGNLQTDRRPPNPDSRVFPYFWAYPRCFSFLLICPATERERETNSWETFDDWTRTAGRPLVISIKISPPPPLSLWDPPRQHTNGHFEVDGRQFCWRGPIPFVRSLRTGPEQKPKQNKNEREKKMAPSLYVF